MTTDILSPKRDRGVWERLLALAPTLKLAFIIFLMIFCMAILIWCQSSLAFDHTLHRGI